MRVFFKNGAYYYVSSNGQKQVWLWLGTDKNKAIDLGNGMNELKQEERRFVLSETYKVETSIRDEVFARDGFKCVYCGSTSNLVPDHFIPYSAGGSSSKMNLVTACLPCNTSKGNQDPRDFIIRLMGLREELLQHFIARYLTITQKF